MNCLESHHRYCFHSYPHPVSAADCHRNDEVLVASVFLQKKAPAIVKMEDGHKEVTSFNVRLCPWPDSGLVSHTGLPSLFLAITT